MKNRKLFYPHRFALLLFAAFSLFATASEISAQKARAGQIQGPLVAQFAPSKTALRMDFSGDLQADIAIVDPASSTWFIYSADNTITTVEFGTSANKPVPGDYDGDKIEDIAVLVSTDGLLTWHILQSSDRATVDVSWGLDGDVAVQGDYDGDGKVDPAVWRPSEGLWHILGSLTGTETILECGTTSDKPMPGDYDGDGITDAAIYRSHGQSLYYLASSTQVMNEQEFGPFSIGRNVTFVPADYDGDGRTDFAMFNPSTRIWTILESTTGEYRLVSIQSNSPACTPSDITPCTITDFALPADYDNDGKVDPAMWSSVDQMVFAVGSTEGKMKISAGGSKGMTAVSSFFMSK